MAEQGFAVFPDQTGLDTLHWLDLAALRFGKQVYQMKAILVVKLQEFEDKRMKPNNPIF